LRDHGGAQGGIAAGLGLDHDRLAEIDLHRLGQATRHDVDDAAHRIGHEEAHRLGGIGLRPGARRDGESGSGTQGGATVSRFMSSSLRI
jgi:hypothetical protein